MPTNDTATALTQAILSALPAAALAVLFALFALAFVIIFIRWGNQQTALFIQSIRDEAERNRHAVAEQNQRWRDDYATINNAWRSQFSEGMTRFANEMSQVNQNVVSLIQQHQRHDTTMQVSLAGLTNAVALVAREATGTGQPKSTPGDS